MRKITHTGAILLVTLLYLCTKAAAQDSTSLYNKLITAPERLLEAIDKKAARAEHLLDRQTDKYLQKLAKQERRIKRKLYRSHPQLADSLFGNIDSQYYALRNTNFTASPNLYSGHLDSLHTALNFFHNASAFSLTNNDHLKEALQHYEGLQNKFNQTDQIRKYLERREQFLKAGLQNLGMVKTYHHFEKKVYYYRAQIQEYKAAFEDPTKLEAKLMELAMRIPQFKTFFAKYSLQGQLFGMPSGYGSPQDLFGLQTRQQVQQLVGQQLGTAPINGVDPRSYLQQQSQAAQQQLSALKEKLPIFGTSSGTGDLSMPAFKPNPQKTKSFLKRLEYGYSFHNQSSRRFLPTISDIILTIGYRLNDKSSFGFGASYKMGWGNSIKALALSSQGVGFKSYVDLRAKGSIWITGGLEYDYFKAFNRLSTLREINVWQNSALAGISKKYRITKSKQGNLQLLYDFFAQRHIPNSQPLQLRLGYRF